jgi:phosphate transport system permease protein
LSHAAPPPAPPRTRRRGTRRSVFVVERLSRWLITAGGLGTILAVSLVFLFLASVVVPLFLPASVRESARAPAANAWRETPPERIAVDDYMGVGWTYFPDGSVEAFRLDTAESLSRRALFEGPGPTASSVSTQDGSALFGFADGTIRFGSIRIAGRFLDANALPEALRQLPKGQQVTHEGGLVERTPDGRLRHQALDASFDKTVRLEPPSKVVLLDHATYGENVRFAAITEDGRLITQGTRGRRDMLTGEVTYTFTGGEVRIPQLKGREPPRHVLISGVGDSTYVIWEDGFTVRADTRDLSAPEVVEMLDLVPEPGARLTALAFMIGRTTLVVGDSLGRVRGWFRIKPEDAGTKDGAILVMAHDLERGSAPVTALATSHRSRMLAAAYGDGGVRLFQMTTGKTVADAEVPAEAPLRSITLSPKDDGLVGTNGRNLFLWHVESKHPDATLASLFRPVWYEGYQSPAHAWQSSSGTDDFEPKFGLWPLVAGTMKATFYSLLFGAPLAILAAIFTSEFLSGRTKARVKPVIETMASLPSVVLGFLAAIVFAPWAEGRVPALLSMFVTLPFTLLLGANLWQALPGQGRGRIRAWRALFLFVASATGVGLGFVVGPVAERFLFEGDIKLWLDGQTGTGTGAWMFLMLPVSSLLVAGAMAMLVNPTLRRISRDWGASAMARSELVKFLLGFVATVGLALFLSWILNWFWDPRGSFVGTYVQRNAMIVGFVMGFAIIPIIYTISEDALSGVPEHLRAASLGAGATQWQTAVRIIIPTAMSGIFSALMVGFGRAVGETMIVLMAAGNTPVLEWNVFNGFRTLSANIAVEMPEAVQESTHYRTLFLAALVLFAMTFVVNTVAEAVRLRVRRKAYEL